MTTRELLLVAKARRLSQSGEGAEARANAGLSLSEVADAIGLSPSALSRWEHAERTPRGTRAAAWAELISELEAERVA